MTDYYGPEGWGAMASRERLEHRERLALQLAIRHRPPGRADEAVVADLGCGDGLMLAAFGGALPGARLLGFDLSPTQLAKARERLPGAELRYADLTRPFELGAGSVDIAYAGEVVEHLWSPDDFLAELSRVLRPGGLALLTTPNLLSWFNRGLVVVGVGPVYVEYSTRDSAVGMGPLRRLKAGSAPVGHVRVLTARALRDLVAAAGLEVVELRGARFEAAPRAVRAIDGAIGRLAPSLAGILVCAARRP